MKPPFSYYGGKQRMASKIVPLIPKHTVYCEPFVGGAAILFAKPWPDVSNTDHYREVINDLDGDLINFFQQLRDNGEELCRQLGLTPYSEEEYRISKDFSNCDDMERARRYYVNIQQSFSNKLNSGWGRGKYSRNLSATWINKISCLPGYIDRMLPITISNINALKFIKDWDSPQTFFYCDPPYPSTDQGHYDGYTVEDFEALIDTLSNIDGSFMLSCYEVDGVAIPDDWEQFSFSAAMSASFGKTLHKKRIETVYRKISTVPVRPELQKLYDSGAFDCFTGRKLVKRVRITEPIKRKQIRCNHGRQI